MGQDVTAGDTGGMVDNAGLEQTCLNSFSGGA